MNISEVANDIVTAVWMQDGKRLFELRCQLTDEQARQMKQSRGLLTYRVGQVEALLELVNLASLKM